MENENELKLQTWINKLIDNNDIVFISEYKKPTLFDELFNRKIICKIKDFEITLYDENINIYDGSELIEYNFIDKQIYNNISEKLHRIQSKQVRNNQNKKLDNFLKNK